MQQSKLFAVRVDNSLFLIVDADRQHAWNKLSHFLLMDRNQLLSNTAHLKEFELHEITEIEIPFTPSSGQLSGQIG